MATFSSSSPSDVDLVRVSKLTLLLPHLLWDICKGFLSLVKVQVSIRMPTMFQDLIPPIIRIMHLPFNSLLLEVAIGMVVMMKTHWIHGSRDQ